MSRHSVIMMIFGVLAVGFPLWAMQENGRDGSGVHQCTGDCYRDWRAATGGVVAVARASAEARAEASPEALGEAGYVGCIACHGANGEGGLGPQLAGTPPGEITAALRMYRNGETRGSQSALMWSQAREMSDNDIENLAAYIQTF